MSKSPIHKQSGPKFPPANPSKIASVKTASIKTTAPSLQIDSEVARSIRQHARAHMKTEVCGVLIGENSSSENQAGSIQIQASIEAVNAAQAGTHVTFTQDAWESIYKIKDQRYPDERIVGWYHSHPGFGVFLSEQDTFIHRNFFSSPGQVAWVYDPHTDEEGCFGWIDGDIHRIPSFLILDNSGDGIERTPLPSELDEDEDLPPSKADRRASPPAWLRWTVTTLSYVCALAVGFLVAYLLFPHFVPIAVDPATGEPLLSLPHPSPTLEPVPQVPNKTTPEPAPKPAPSPKQGGPK